MACARDLNDELDSTPSPVSARSPPAAPVMPHRLRRSQQWSPQLPSERRAKLASWVNTPARLHRRTNGTCTHRATSRRTAGLVEFPTHAKPIEAIPSLQTPLFVTCRERSEA